MTLLWCRCIDSSLSFLSKLIYLSCEVDPGIFYGTIFIVRDPHCGICLMHIRRKLINGDSMKGVNWYKVWSWQVLLLIKLHPAEMPWEHFAFNCPLHRRVHGDPDRKVHGANIGPNWVLLAPDGPHVGPVNLGIRRGILSTGDISYAKHSKCSVIWRDFSDIFNDNTWTKVCLKSSIGKKFSQKSYAAL